MSPRGRLGAVCLALFLGGGGTVPALAAPALGPETVASPVSGGTEFGWMSRFEAAVDGGAVRVRVGVRLVPAGGVTRVELARAIPPWRAGVERAWSGRFAVDGTAGEPLPIMVAVDFVGPDFHHDVVVRPGRGPTDQLGWHLGDPPEVIAHEIGHMLGAYDDYRGGANSPAGPVDDAESLMHGNPPPGAIPRPRHLERLREWFAARSGGPARIVVLGPGGAAGWLAQRQGPDAAGGGELP